MAAHTVPRDGMTYSVELDYDPWNTNLMEAMFSFTDVANSHQHPDPFQMASDEGALGRLRSVTTAPRAIVNIHEVPARIMAVLPNGTITCLTLPP